MGELAKQKCVPCEGGVAPLTADEAAKLAAQTPGWEVREDRIERVFKFSNYTDAMAFANRITPIAEAENHHPQLHVSWGKVRVELTTHAIGGLSINDFILAAKINELET